MSGHDLELRVLDRLGPLAAEWDELAARQPTPSPFLRSWWIEHAAGGALVLACWFSDGRLVGGVAFERDRPGRSVLSIERLRAVGQGVLAPDHLDLIATDEHRSAIRDAALDWLRRPGSRLVDVDGLLAQGQLASLLGTLGACEVVERTGAPYALLPSDAEEYLAGRPGRVRSTITRSARRLQREGLVHRSVDGSDPVEVERALGDLARLHDGRWADDSVFLRAWERFAAAARSGLAAGEVTIDELVTAHGDVVATELDVVVGDRTCFYQAGRHTGREYRGGGSVLRHEIIRRAIAQGHREYDLLRGDEDYKRDWAGERRELVHLRVGVGAGGAAAMGAMALRRRVRELSRRAASARARRAHRAPSD